jgi:REP element-mobilizing transposase RayT
MARPIRVEFDGAVYHVTARGNERKRIYRDEADRRSFLGTLEEAVKMHGLRLHAYCLMPNHYHLLVETPRGNVSRAIGWLQTTYSIRFNHRYRRSGHLFQGRFKAHLIEADDYAMTLLRYVHLNPVRPRDKAAPIPAERREAFESYPWCSHAVYAGRGEAPDWLCTDWLGFFHSKRKEAQRRYRRFVDDAFGTVIDNPWTDLRMGLALAGEELLARVRNILEAKLGQEEVRWVARAERGEHRVAAAQALAEAETERRWQVWIRVRLGSERRIDVARAYGYKDGSAISQIIKRLEAEAAVRRELAARIARLQAAFEQQMSSVKS